MDKMALERLCNALDLALGNNGGGRVESGTVTPYEIRLVCQGGRTPDVAALAAALGVPARVCGNGNGGFAVVIPRSDTFPVLLSSLLRGLQNVPPVTAVLGVAEDGVPLLVHLPSPDVGHVLVTGPRGCGKSALLRAMAVSLSHFTPGLRVATAPRPADLERLVAVRRRAGEDEPRVVAVYDGLPEDTQALRDVLEAGGLWGVHVILAGEVGPLRGLFPVAIEGTAQAGDFWAYAGGEVIRFWAAWPDDGLALPGR